MFGTFIIAMFVVFGLLIAVYIAHMAMVADQLDMKTIHDYNSKDPSTPGNNERGNR